MKNKKLLLCLSAIILPSFLIPFALLNFTDNSAPFPEDFYLGVTASGSVTEAFRLIDKVKDFTNLIVITELEVTTNKTSLDAVADYAYKAGLNFFVYMIYPSPNTQFNYDPFKWAAEAKSKYGDQFMGYYLWDEPGGHQLDLGNFRQFDTTTMPSNYRDAANTFVYYLYIQMRDFIKIDKLATSDYGLYWYDYEAGYDVVFCHFAWNHSREVHIALCRGAAEMHNKTWGAIITWTYEDPPYIESPAKVYEDMVTAYQAGAKYVIIFNYPQTGPYGLLTEEYFDVIKEFKKYVSQNPQNATSNTAKIAYVVPDNYGWGFRSPNDKIWGVWNADDKSQTIWNDISNLTQTYGCNFDIIYGSPWTRLFSKFHYDNLIWWDENQSALKPHP
ncbi:MAG: hypothetical protein NWE94_07810 [Candidatus Bathyarchaeota archaeon]|nr:hypothetical protein [Candidatus Bathyarchaeota archaeon]